MATRLHGAGYRTGLFGKYMNRYADTTYRPPGWDRWFAASTLGDPKYFNYDVNDDGTIRHYGTNDSDYMTDVLSRKTNTFIKNSAPRSQPFFAYVAPIAPHAPATPAPARRAYLRRREGPAPLFLQRGEHLRQAALDQAASQAHL